MPFRDVPVYVSARSRRPRVRRPKDDHLHVSCADGHGDRLPALAAGLVRSNVDVIVAWGVGPLEAARKATSRIPIVAVGRSDPVATGVVASLAKPGGNVTGITPISEPALAQETQAAARALTLRALDFPVASPADFDRAFLGAVRQGAQAVVMNESSMLTAHRARLAELSLTNRLPAVGLFRLSVDVGFLISYGPDFADVNKRAASFVDRILRGAKPAMTVPPAVLMRADYVVE